MAARPESINVTDDKLEAGFEDQKDCVVLLEDKKNTSNYQKKNGVEAVNYLSNMIYDHINSVYNDSLFVTVVFSERLSQMMQSSKALVIDYSNFSAGSDCLISKLFALTYYLDDLIVKRVCSNYADFYNCVQQNKLLYENRAKEYQVDPVTFTCLMLVYHEMIKQFGRLGSLVSEDEMESYLAEILTASDKSYNGGSIAEEFKTRLNQMLVNGDLELVRNSSMNDCYGSTGTKPIIFNDDQWLYIPAETFAGICEKLTLSNTVGSVRKSLNSEGWLRTSEDNMTYKATLYDNYYSGKRHVTAVTASLLSDEALKMQRGGMFNFTPYVGEDADRILLGTDEHGRNVYWSIGHDNLKNIHLLVSESSGTGKTTTVNLIVKELFAKNKQIIYVDFSHSDTPGKLKQNGLDEAFQREHIIRYALEEFLSDNELLKLALMDIATEQKILIFETEKYGEPVEEFLNLLYHTIVNDEALDVFLVIDEVHELDYEKGSAVYHIMEKGRSNGISLIGIFQGPHEVKPKQYTMMNQADVKLIFKQSDQSDGKTLAIANGLKPPGAFTEHILGLKKRHCLVIGNLESDDGELMNGRFVEITVPKV